MLNTARAVRMSSGHLHISRVPLAVPPRAADAREGSLRMVELAVVSVEEKRGEGLLQEEQTNHFHDLISAVRLGGSRWLKFGSV